MIYLLHSTLQNAYTLYCRYSTDWKKFRMCKFQQDLGDDQVFFELEQWPNSLFTNGRMVRLTPPPPPLSDDLPAFCLLPQLWFLLHLLLHFVAHFATAPILLTPSSDQSRHPRLVDPPGHHTAGECHPWSKISYTNQER